MTLTGFALVIGILVVAIIVVLCGVADQYSIGVADQGRTRESINGG